MTIGIGIVGAGYWGPNLIRNFVEAPGSRVVSVCDLRADRLAKIGARYPTVKTTTDYRDLLGDPEVDAIVVATPIATHYELALLALWAGKHVLVEKPLATKAVHAQHLVEEAARRRLVLMVDHTFVYSGAVRKIRELVSEGVLGPIYYYDSVRINLGLVQRDVNVLWDLAVHDLSIMDYVLGLQPRAISATGACHVGNVEDVAYLTCYFDHNVIAHFHVSWLSPVKVRRTLIGGANRMIAYDDVEPSEKVKVYDRGVTMNNGHDGLYNLMVGYRMGDTWAPQLNTAEALQVEVQHFLECITHNREPITNGEVGLRVVHMLEVATRSLAVRSQPLDLYLDRASA